MTRLRLLLGDQLNERHAWFRHAEHDVVYVLMEVRQETDYVLHHAQKVIAIFAAMRRFAERLRACGHRVHYIAIDAADNTQSLPRNLDRLIEHYQVTHFAYQQPDEWRLDRQLDDHAAALSIPTQIYSSEHFYTDREEARKFFADRHDWLMERFYRHLRVKHDVLMAAGKPLGGRWNFDAENRHAWHGDPPELADPRPAHDHRALWRTIEAAGVKTFGDAAAHDVRWPLDRDEALHLLDHFIAHRVSTFGKYQDAMNSVARRLFHSQLSFALNVKMLAPREVVARAAAAYANGIAPLPSVEGFVRQILGWREYVRGVYWATMPGYDTRNAFGYTRALPAMFWTGATRMRCMAISLGDSLAHAYAHHIQRLMIIGNFALLAGLNPADVHRWYLGVYVDAFEWVELPNTLGLSQFADGGMVATKPYVSGAAYVDRMSDYCNGCSYLKKKRTGERACPFNALYWNFFDTQRALLRGNPRLTMVYRQLDAMTADVRAAIGQHAARVRENLDAL